MSTTRAYAIARPSIMSTQTQTERNAVNAVRDYVDASHCLRSYLEANDKTPLWDGHVFVFKGTPDKKENLIGTLKAQIKGTEVDAFLKVERFRLTVDELKLYMQEGGLFFFVVEMLKSNVAGRQIFYKKLTPIAIKAMLAQNNGKQSIEFSLNPLPTDCRMVEDEMMNFINDARKQTSFVDKPGLSLDEVMNGTYRLKAEGVANTQGNPSLAMLLTSQPFTLYQETSFASIPVSDVELTTRVTEQIDETVSISGVTYFLGYSKIYNLKTITINIGDCFITTSPKKGYENSLATSVEIRYPQKGSISEALRAIEFLVALKDSREITFGNQTVELQLDEIRSELFKNTDYNYAIYRDIAALWRQMQIPGEFSFDDFDETGLQQYLNVVQHVYRKEPGIPMNPMKDTVTYFSPVQAGPLVLLVRFTHLHNNLYASEDAFAEPYLFQNDKRYPLLTAALAKSKDVLFDNIHYDEQLACYRQCQNDEKDFEAVIQHDLVELTNRIHLVEKKEKRAAVEQMINELKAISKK